MIAAEERLKDFTEAPLKQSFTGSSTGIRSEERDF
jgi:hypothetical protein